MVDWSSRKNNPLLKFYLRHNTLYCTKCMFVSIFKLNEMDSDVFNIFMACLKERSIISISMTSSSFSWLRSYLKCITFWSLQHSWTCHNGWANLFLVFIPGCDRCVTWLQMARYEEISSYRQPLHDGQLIDISTLGIYAKLRRWLVRWYTDWLA